MIGQYPEGHGLFAIAEIVFGTGKVSKQVIQVCPNGIINLHGGNPEEYRGLDSHLWAIYHHDFSGLVTTLHRINEELDDGDIILQMPIQLRPDMGLHELRRYNTDVCIEMVLSAFDMFNRQGYMIDRPQQKRGRYYSFMPSVIKEICLKYFNQYVVNL